MNAARRPLTQQEAEQRAKAVRDVAYRLDVDLVAGAKTYRGDATVRFVSSGADTFLEFAGQRIDRFEVNGRAAEPDWDGQRIALPVELLSDANEVRVVYENEYDHTGEGFHQFVDPQDGAEYLYTGFEPYQAHRLFPCFDQPDLKAQYELIVTAPEDWEVLSAGRETAREPADGDRSRRSFELTVPFSTYLFSVVAGPYRVATDSHDGLPLGIYCRASLFEHLDAEEIFALTKQGLDFYVDYFQHPYPFTKYDQVFVPEFNWGGMENVGNVTYAETLVFRDPPTMPQLVRRGEILLHELAHMWFGDLVTMRWWDDLWLNESFATFIAYAAMDRATSFEHVWQDFNTRVKVVGYRDDQLPTTHPIADDVETTDETFLNFDQITYGKGASTLRQLEAAIGEEALRDGLRTYIGRHAFGNATLPQFLAALQQGSGKDLVHWAARWLKTASLNTIRAEWEQEGALVRRLRLHQSAPPDHPTLRPHHLEVALVIDEPAGLRVATVPAEIDKVQALVPAATGLPAPALVFPNHRDLGYCKVALDPQSLAFVTDGLGRIADPLFRQLLWASLWEMVRDRELPSLAFLDLVARHLPGERNVQILRIVTMRALELLRAYVPEERIDAESDRFARLSRAAIEGAEPGDPRVIWAEALIGAAGSPDALATAGRVVDGEEDLEGLRVSQEMRWSVAVRWAAHAVPGTEDRLGREAARDSSDRGRRALLRAEVSAPDAGAKAEAWQRIIDRDYGSLHMALSAMGGFRWRHQRDLLAPYVEQYFAALPGVFSDWDFEAARGFFSGLFPAYRVDEETLDRCREVLAGTEDRRLRRLLRESIDRLERALACRAIAAAHAPGPAPPAPVAVEEGAEAASPVAGEEGAGGDAPGEKTEDKPAGPVG